MTTCPQCGGPAYVGLTVVECEGACRKAKPESTGRDLALQIIKRWVGGGDYSAEEMETALPWLKDWPPSDEHRREFEALMTEGGAIKCGEWLWSRTAIT